MSETRFHGARVTENTDLVTAINDVDSSVIGIVATADDADAKLFPLNKPTLLTRVNDVLGKCGTTGTLYRALKAIADQVSTKVIVVRVAEHKEEDGKTQDQLVIGGSEDVEACVLVVAGRRLRCQQPQQQRNHDHYSSQRVPLLGQPHTGNERLHF